MTGVDILLGLLALGVFLLLITVLMNLWIGVPSVPTPMPIVRAMIDLADLKEHETIVDLGAGDGRLLIEAKRQFPGICARGWEIIPTVWLMGIFRMIMFRTRVKLFCGDALKADVSDADVVFLYLFPPLLQKLVDCFDRDLKPGTRVLSHTFRLPGKTPISDRKVKGYMGETSIFLYQW